MFRVTQLFLGDACRCSNRAHRVHGTHGAPPTVLSMLHVCVGMLRASLKLAMGHFILRLRACCIVQGTQHAGQGVHQRHMAWSVDGNYLVWHA